MNENHTAVSPADMELPVRGQQMEKEADKGYGSPAHIHVHSRRNRLTDEDGISAKYAIDALIAGGILPDDRKKYVSGVSYSQEKTKGPEITEITITG